jgi:serine/threonine-protein kinase RsbW
MVRHFGKEHGVSDDTVFVINLSLDELVTNIVVHAGNRDPKAREIMLRMSINNAEVRVEIEDDGTAFNPLDIPKPDLNAPLQDRDPGGLGIHLARSLMDGIRYSRVGRRNLLTLTKRIA